MSRIKLKLEGARAPLDFIPPRLNPLVVRILSHIAPFYVRTILGVRVLPPEHIERLAREFQDFFNNSSRLLLVFRHVHVHDAQVMFYLFNRILPAEARRLGIPLSRRPHAHFLYGRGVPIWGGRRLEWLFSRMGGISVFHRQLARDGLDEVRAHLTTAPYPMALAPEGQVTYHNGIVHSIEPGFAHIALWARQEFMQKGIDQDVRILPICQHYHYGRDGKKVLERLLTMIRAETGISFDEKGETGAAVKTRLLHAGSVVLDLVEDFYRRFYGLRDLFEVRTKPDSKPKIGSTECSTHRVERIVDAVLRMQEERLGVLHPPKGFTPRIFTVRQAGWNRIFRKKSGPGDTRSPLDGALDDFIAVETGLFARHLEVVDLLAYLKPEYALESEDSNRHVEFALNLLDAISRLKGGTIGQRYHVRPTRVSIRIGEPISVNALLSEHPELSTRGQRSRLIDEVNGQFVKLSY